MEAPILHALKKRKAPMDVMLCESLNGILCCTNVNPVYVYERESERESQIDSQT